MVATVHELRPRPAPLAGFLRVGHTGQNQLAALQAAGRFPYRRVVFDAAYLSTQTELLRLLRSSGCEIVLDPNFGEMATVGRYQGSIGKLPWANPDRPWEVTDFGPGRNANLAKLMAEYAVAHGVNVVLAPSHLIEAANDPWRTVDHRLCERLRRELDGMGGKSIAIDYQLITAARVLKDEEQRRQLISGIEGLPIQNVWVRVSGFGATATGAGTRQFIESIQQLHNIKRPLVGDHVGGLSSIAALAFGAIAGISHGIAQKESFDSYGWKHPRGPGGGGSRRIYIPELDRHFTEEQLIAIFNTRGGRSKFACNDTRCCSDIDEMIENSNSHFINQRSRQIENLSKVQESRRVDHFLLNHVDPAVRSARLGARLKISDDQVKEVIEKARGRLIRMRDTLDDLRATHDSESRSMSLAFRGGGGSISAILGH